MFITAKSLFVGLLAGLIAQTANGKSMEKGTPLSAALAPYKFRHVKLSQHGVDLSLHGTINRVPAALVLSTAAPLSVLDRGSLKKFGIAERKTGIPVNSELGKTDERIGFGKVNSFEFANIVLADFEAGTLDESVLDRTAPASSGHIDGVFALSQMRKLGAVIDCGHRDLHVNPWGPRADASGQLAKVLANRGFVRIPMRLNRNGHLEVDCHVNGRPAIITVETAAFATMIDRKLATNAGVLMADDAVKAEGVGHRQAPLESSLVRQFSVGDFQSNKNKIRVGDLTFNVLGIDFLSSNDAVIDTGGMNLFLHQ